MIGFAYNSQRESCAVLTQSYIVADAVPNNVLLTYKRVVTNLALGHYEPPKLKCRKSPFSNNPQGYAKIAIY